MSEWKSDDWQEQPAAPPGAVRVSEADAQFIIERQRREIDSLHRTLVYLAGEIVDEVTNLVRNMNRLLVAEGIDPQLVREDRQVPTPP